MIYWFPSFMLYFLPDGQKLACRIKKQQSACSKKITKLLSDYNQVPPFGDLDPPHSLVREDILDPASLTWQQAAERHQPSHPFPSSIPPSVRRKAIETIRMKERAAEEVQLCCQNYRSLQHNLLEEINLCEKLKLNLASASDSVSRSGALAMVVGGRLKSVLSIAECVKSILSNSTVENIGQQLDERVMDEIPPEASGFRPSIQESFSEDEDDGDEDLPLDDYL